MDEKHRRTLRCEDVNFLVSKAWDGEITPDDAGRLADHLRSCSECAATTKRFVSFLCRLEPNLGRGAGDS